MGRCRSPEAAPMPKVHSISKNTTTVHSTRVPACTAHASASYESGKVLVFHSYAHRGAPKFCSQVQGQLKSFNTPRCSTDICAWPTPCSVGSCLVHPGVGPGVVRGRTCADVVCQLIRPFRHSLSQVNHQAHRLDQRREEELRPGVEFILGTPAGEFLLEAGPTMGSS